MRAWRAWISFVKHLFPFSRWAIYSAALERMVAYGKIVSCHVEAMEEEESEQEERMEERG